MHAVYSGVVQGVGFRFTAERIAKNIGITGFVRNLPNGNVEVVCEGERPQIDSFL
ncbi:MAG: acylphosphatase, partial [Candidatus Omnitrophica bacterium]|nr:acylphosphatase [Candidatus Omnitrophota bacterium]